MEPKVFLPYINKVLKKNDEIENNLIAIARTAEGKKLAQDLFDQESAFNKLIENKIVPLVKAKNINEAQKVIDNELDPLADKAYTAAQNLIDFRIKKNTNVVNTASKAAKTAENIMIILSVTALFLGLVIAFIISRLITKPVHLLNEGALAIAEGNLTRQVGVKSKDEIGDLAATFNKMSVDLRNMIKKIIDTAQTLSATSEELSATSEQTSSASEQVANTISQLAAGATEQAKSVEETNTIISEMSASTQQVAASAANVSESSIKVAQMAKDGVGQAENAIKKMKQVEESTFQTSQVIDKLGEESKSIGDIVNVIKDIAEQTNLLALNAAIEAARAGEQGRGFAVVAEEVRKLAEQSALSAGQIASLIESIQKETERAINVMKKGKVEVSAGVEAVNVAGSAFETIVTEINQVVEQIQQVSVVAQQMAGNAGHAVQSVSAIASISEQTAAGAQEVSAAAEEQTASMEAVASSAQDLAKLGETLQNLVVNFKV